MVLRDNQIRLFDKHLAALPGLDDLPSRKVALRSKENVVIPSHTIGFIEVYSPETYVEATTRQQPNHEYSIPGCITSTGGVISVRNAADSNLVFRRGQLLVRGLPCKLKSSTNEVSNFSITPCNLQQFLVDDVTNQLGPNLTERERFQRTKAKPLTKLTKANMPFIWGKEQEEAFRFLKQRLVERPVLALQTSKMEEKYHSYELETLAVVDSMRRFGIYLLGIHFTVVTDCNAIRTTMTKRDLIPRVGRWWLLTQEYDFTVEYRAGQKMAHVDALSRNSLQEEINDHENEFYVQHMNINEDDWGWLLN
ncbi:hypothetical protein GEV33_005824 [Tenebrio molitor]|uniref:Reverse transcriptase RNase H-like domain-containing protein n=1 Tax=Tenebrio molitor TaxID=7067 RepID=A0A8J6LEK4_TENMO|nr:hypothetical protein GEV33_005824 [Tenebrio molitor]